MTELKVVEAGRYENVCLGDKMLASYNKSSGNLVVYDDRYHDEEPALIVDAARGVNDD